ncbi:alpha/beta hydrolase-fold protein [Sphingomonas sp.]|uniref:alpha/beta hydrolase n=1 Tax=Sphingomonas sp. TaxID=28214 RepID=UPI00286E15BF|nr:alpha/beta hydrolase-fold protein [Sphingomonas sp.]
MRLLHLIAALAAVSLAAPASANPQLALVEGARANMDLLAPERVRGKKFAYDHELTIALPASYAALPRRTYPVLWVLDGPLMTRLAVGTLDTLVIGNHAPEMIVIGVGSPAADGLAGVSRRIMEYSPPGKGYAPPGLNGEKFTALAPIPDFPQRADDFLGLLVDELRPMLAARYRFSGEHALFGHSAGGMLAAYAMFQRPGAFQKMILGSPYVNGVAGAVFKAEQAFAARHKDLDVDLFVGVGGAEVDEYFLAVSGIASGTARFAETLHLRGYQSLTLETRVYSGEDHYTVVPRLLGEGIRHLWKKEAAALGSSWPQRP